MDNLRDYITTIETGKRPAGGAKSSGVPSLSAEHMDKDGHLHFGSSKMKYVSEEYYKTLKTGKLRDGDVVIVKDGATTGKVAFIDEVPVDKACINEHCFILRANENLLNEYLFFYLFSPIGNARVLDSYKGATIGGIGKTFIDMPIRVPSLEKQKQIVSVLRKQRHIIALYNRQLESLDSLIKSRFVELFGDLKANNKKWPIVKFTDIASIDTRMIHSFDGYENYPHIGIDSIEKNTGKLSGFRTVKEDGVISGKYLFDERHIIYSKIRPNLNKVALPTFSGVCSADAYPILPNVELCTREFLAYVMRSDLFLDYILAFSNRTNLPKVNKMQVEGFECPLPALEQQKVFVELINQIDKSKLAQVMYRL